MTSSYSGTTDIYNVDFNTTNIKISCMFQGIFVQNFKSY